MSQATSSPQRKLAAIMFTDIAGYTQAMSSDEESALKTLKKKRSILKPLINENNGTFVKEIGDGTLSYFRSAIDAASCAVSLQQATYDDTDMNLRIGVHIGDIVFDDEDVFGDGVNVAARLESMAPVGGVCVSKSVFEELLNKKEFDGIPLGLQQLKGVGRLIDVFALKAKNLIHPDPTEYEEHKVEPHSDDEVPSVAVLPFINKGKEEDAFYAYGITADLISEMSGAGKIRVASMDNIEVADAVKLSSQEAAKKLNVRYIVTGVLWKHEDLFQLSIEVDDTKTNNVIWADRWQEEWAELTTIKGKLVDGLFKILDKTAGKSKRYTPVPEAYEYYLKGQHKYGYSTCKEDVIIARGLLKQALEIDPGLIIAKITLAATYYRENAINEGIILLNESLDESEAYGSVDLTIKILAHFGFLYSINKDRDQALEFYKKALLHAENANDINSVRGLLINLGINYSKIGKYDEAQAYYQQSLDVCKELEDDRQLLRAYRNIGNLYHETGEYVNALHYFKQAFVVAEHLVAENLNDEVEVGWSYFTLGGVYRDLARYNDALTAYEHAEVGLINLQDQTIELFISTQKSWCNLHLNNRDVAISILNDIEEKLPNFTPNFGRELLLSFIGTFINSL